MEFVKASKTVIGINNLVGLIRKFPAPYACFNKIGLTLTRPRNVSKGSLPYLDKHHKK